MMMKRLFIYVFLCLIYIPAEAARVVDGINYEFDRDNKLAYVIEADASAPYTGDIVIPEKVKVGINEFTVVAIQRYAFNGDEITSLSLPASIVEIQDYAFEACTQLTSLILPDGLTKIGKEAFYGCRGLVELKLPNNSEIVLGEYAFAYLENLKKLTIPNSWTSLEARGCFEYSGISELQIGKNLKYIGSAVFLGCSNLTTITCSKNCVLEEIGSSAFAECTSLQDLKFLPKSLKIIGSHAFSGCSNLREVSIPYWVEKIYSGSWQNLSTSKLIIADGTTPFTLVSDRPIMAPVNVYLGRPMVGNSSSLFSTGELKRLDFGPYFEGGSEWKFGKNVRLIYSCVTDPTKLTFEFEEDVYDNATLYVPVGTIDEYMAQKNFSKFFDVREFYPEGYLVEGALNPRIDFADKLVKRKCLNNWDTNYDCELTLSEAEAVTDIGTVFQYQDITSFDEFKYFTGLTSIPEKAFFDCTYLESIELPSTITTIENKAFCYCYSLKSIIIGNNVSDIGEYAFNSCENLTSVTLGSNVTSIGDNAFLCGGNIPDFYCYSKKAPKADNAFGYLNSSQVIASRLYVPAKYIDNYKSAEPWKHFSNIAEMPDVNLNKTEAILEKGKTMTLKVTVSPSSLEDKSVTWESSNTAVATVSSSGKVKGVKAGTAVITCTSNATGISATCTVTVSYVKLDLSEAILEKGKTVTLTPTVYPSALEDKSVTWKSSNTAVATVSSKGKVKGVKAGTVDITCISNATGLSATCTVTVGYVKLDKTEAFLEKTKTMTLTPTVYPSTLEDKSVTWESSNTAVATVSSKGKVKGVKAGTAEITCTSVATGLSTTCTVTVSYVKLDQTEAIIEKGKTLTLTPTIYPSALEDKSVTWESSDKTIATVTSKGKVKGVKAGMAVITCTSVATGLSTTCTVTVPGVVLDKTEAFLEKTKTMTLTPTMYPSTLEDQSVTWKSSNTAIATVSSKGKVKGVKAGIVTITCTSKATGESATCQVTVGYVKLDKTEAILEKGKTLTLKATVYPSALEDKSVTWKSSNTVVATVSSKGKVTGVKAGTAVITCTSNATGLSTTCTVTVGYVKLDQTEAILEKSKTLTLTPTVYPSALEDKSVTWKSSNTVVATVSSKGKVTGVKAGTAVITCTSNATGLSTTCTVTVGYVKLDKIEATVQKGKTLTLTPTVYPSALEDKSVTWKSSDETIATVTSAGKVKGVKAGTATITCTSNATGLSTTCKITVTKSASARTIDGEDAELTDVEMVEVTPAIVEPFDVFDLSGHKVRQGVTSLDGLPAGVYIVNGKKVLKK